MLEFCLCVVELAFWNNRLKNFTQIYKQLSSEKIHSMAMILEATESAYFSCFSTMFKNVVSGKCWEVWLRARNPYIYIMYGNDIEIDYCFMVILSIYRDYIVSEHSSTSTSTSTIVNL